MTLIFLMLGPRTKMIMHHFNKIIFIFISPKMFLLWWLLTQVTITKESFESSKKKFESLIFFRMTLMDEPLKRECRQPHLFPTKKFHFGNCQKHVFKYICQTIGSPRKMHKDHLNIKQFWIFFLKHLKSLFYLKNYNICNSARSNFFTICFDSNEWMVYGTLTKILFNQK